MKTIFVDDEIWMMQQFEAECNGLPDIQLVGKFDDPYEALEFVQDNQTDLAFLDVEMPGMDGIELARKLREIYPNMIIIFVSAYDKYMREAFSIDADYYVMKPYTKENIEAVLSRAKLLAKRLKKQVYIQTFGRFELFIDDKPVTFKSAKAKELLALLVDRKGGILGSEEAFSLMWEDKPYDNVQASAYRRALKKLQDTLKENGVDYILQYLPHGRAINVDAVDCDFYQYLDGDPKAIHQFAGEYMSNYSWAETTLAGLLANIFQD